MLQDLRANGVRCWWLRPSSRSRAPTWPPIGSRRPAVELADAIERAERLGERRVLWEALALSATVQDRKERSARQPSSVARARAIVDEIAAGLADPDLRQRFLARDDIRALDEGG